mmetsp:Transcript_3884/g.7513  ORF Transcript_3884/g.7513 Transcript_3884/m.7513 type:complete len:81 (-) Transcript_3884:564-806(-)
MMRWAAGVLCVVLSLATCDGSISVSRTVTELEMANVDVELDGCVQKDKYGCSAFNTDFGKVRGDCPNKEWRPRPAAREGN